MRNILQITADHNLKEIELWFDVMDVPPEVNNLESFLEQAKLDFKDRKVRIIQTVEV